jgi:hypothetical protein
MSTPAQATAKTVKPKTTVATKISVERKTSLETVQNGLSSRKDTEKTVPYVLLRKPTKIGGRVTRQIINFITVGDTVQESHTRSMRIVVIQGHVWGTNYNVPGSGVTDVRKARFFHYTAATGTPHGLSAKTVEPWSNLNDAAVMALTKLGAITQFELEFHLDEAKRRRITMENDRKMKAVQAKNRQDLSELTALAKTVVKAQGLSVARGALRKAHAQLV